MGGPSVPECLDLKKLHLGTTSLVFKGWCPGFQLKSDSLNLVNSLPGWIGQTCPSFSLPIANVAIAAFRSVSDVLVSPFLGASL